MTKQYKKSQAVGRQALRDTICEQLIDDILSGRLLPGSRILETRLAKRFGVSQAPVREALRDLATWGFVECLPFRSTYVRQISTDELIRSHPIRAALESLAAKEAATCIDDETLARLEEHILTIRRAAAVNDLRALADVDYSFHQTIVRAAGNRMLEHLWRFMRLATMTLVTHSMRQMGRRSISKIGERHVAVLEALRSRDPLLAETAMRKHIEEMSNWIRS